MAELQMDTLGAPRLVTGAEYMDALARLGWNKENMFSELPTVTKVASSLTSFMDQQYKSALDYQKSQVDMAETVARSNQINTQTDQLRQTLPMRLKQMDLANQQQQNSLDFSNQTLDFRIQQEKLKAQQQEELVRHSKVIDPYLEDQQKQQNQATSITLDQARSQQQRDQQALDDLPTALDELPDPHDVNYEDELTQFFKNHPNAATNPKTAAQIQTRLKSNDLVRSTLSSFQEQTAAQKQLQDMKVTGDIPASTDIDRLKSNPDDAHLVMSRGNVTRTNRQISEILSSIPADAPADVQRVAADLKNLQNNTIDILESENGMNQVRSGAKSHLYDANGNLNPAYAGEIQSLQSYVQERIKQGLGKPITGKVTLTKPLTPAEAAAGVKPSTVEVENVPLEQIPAVTANQGRYFPQTPEERAKLEQDTQAQANKVQQSVGEVLQKNPDVQALLDRANSTNTTQDWQTYLDALKSKMTKPTSSSDQSANVTTQPVAFQPDTSGSKRINAVFNNPGAMGLTKSALRFGATPSGKTDTGHAFAQFPTREAGAAAQFSMWQNRALYRDHPLSEAIKNWIGPGEHGEAEYIANRLGISLDTNIDDAFLRSPMGIRLMQAQAEYEGQNVLTPEQWQRGQDWAYKGVNPFAGRTA